MFFTVQVKCLITLVWYKKKYTALVNILFNMASHKVKRMWENWAWRHIIYTH